MALKFTKRDEESCPGLLRLPLELRQQIYSHLLPRTIKLYMLRRDNGREYAWERGNIALLSVNRQIHEETMAMLYGGTNVFVLQVDYDGTRFQFQRIMKSGLIPRQTPRFLDKVQLHNIRYLKHLIINVNHVDSYAGMTNYNCGGRGLTSGLKLQVKKLVDVLKTANELVKVQVHLIDHGFTFGKAAEALEPFADLQNVQDGIVVTGVDDSSDFLDITRRKQRAAKTGTQYESAIRPKTDKTSKPNKPLPDLNLSNLYQERHAAPKEYQGFPE